MTTVGHTLDRRVTRDRRVAGGFRLRERRRGFDRRAPARLDVVLRSIATSRVLAAGLLATFVTLNLFDLAATTILVERGAVELNPVMRALLGAGLGEALALKLAVTGAAAGGYLLGRRHRSVVIGMLGITALLGLLTVYHLVNLAIVA